MLKRIILFLCVNAMGWPLFCQSLPVEIATELRVAKNDSSKVLAFYKVAEFYRERDRDSAIKYITQAISICEKNGQLLMNLKFKDLMANQFLGKQQFFCWVFVTQFHSHGSRKSTSKK